MTGLFAQPAAAAFSVLHQSLGDLILLRTSSQLSRSTCDKYSCMFSGHLHVTPDSHLRCCSICTTHCCMVCLMESFSRSRTQPHGSSPAPDNVITSRMCCVSCTGFLSGDDESTTRCLLHQSLSGLAPAYLADDVNLVAAAVATFSDQQLTGHVLSHVHTTPLATGVSLLPVRECGTIYRLSCNRTSATDNSKNN